MTTFAFNAKAFGYHPYNAYSLASVAQLAYAPRDIALQVISDWGFDTSRIRFFDKNDTQAILLADDEKILVAFRGSEPVLADWITNAKIRKTASPAGNVHRGFYAAFNQVWIDVEDAIEELRAGEIPQSLWFTGHSLGGALATLATMACKFNELPIVVNGLYTYGSPRVGSERFAANFNNVFRGQTFRIVNNNDVVTRVPPSNLDYSHVGQLKYFDHKGDLYSDNQLSWWGSFWDRMAGRLDSFSTLEPDGIEDHNLDFRYVPLLQRQKIVYEQELAQGN
jgi:triacylglycerol lipase